MDREHKGIKWQKNTKAVASDDHLKGGEHIAMESQEGRIVEKRTLTPHKICNPDFHKKYLKFNYSYPDG